MTRSERECAVKLNLEAVRAEVAAEAVKSACAFLEWEEYPAVTEELAAVARAASVAELKAALPSITRAVVARHVKAARKAGHKGE